MTFFATIVFFVAAAKDGILPVNLACELRKNPLGIDVANPGLSYTLQVADAAERGVVQTAYQILVSGNAQFKTGSILWDSRQVKTDRMAFISYAGKALVSGRQYFWKVRVWDQNGSVSAWSKTASWTMGMLSPADWRAGWISVKGAEKYALSPVGYKSADAVSENETKWVQVDLGSPRPFSEILLYPLFYADRGGYAFPRRFRVQVSNDASFRNSTTVANYTVDDFRADRYAPAHVYKGKISARYVRISVTKLANTGSAYAFALRQIEVISSGKNIAAGKPVYASDSDETNGFHKTNLTDRVQDYKTFPNYSSVLFRKDVKVKKELVRAVIFVSGLSAYELTINGKKTGNYLFSPGWTDYKKTVLYDTYDITGMLKRGNNVLGIMLGNGMYNIQPDTLRYVKFLNTFGPAKAIAQLRLEYADKSVEMIGTDKTWKAAPGPITYSNLYGGEDYNANLQSEGWDKPGFKIKDTWQAALETAGPGGILKGLSCAAPPVAAIDTLMPVKINPVSKTLLIYDFGQNASMMPLLQVSGAKGSSVRIIPSELLGENGLADRSSATQDGVRPAWWQYTLSGKGDEHWFPKFFYQGARYLQVELYPSPDGKLPQIKQLADVIVHSTSKPVGRFECSNTLFNQIYGLVRWAQRSNMMSFMTDCPHREKMGWLEENHLNGPSLRYNFDMSLLFRKTMNDMADAQLDNGLIPNIAPEYFIAGSPDLKNGMRNSPEWGSSFIIVPWQQYLFSGDISLLSRYYSRMKRYVGFLANEAKDNIIHTGLGDWYDIGPKEPWGSQLTPVSFTGTAIYYYDNWIMYRIAQTLGEKEDAIHFKQAYTEIKEAFNKTFYNKEKGIYATGSQTCSAMPLFFDLAGAGSRPQLLNALVDDIHNNQNSFTTGEVGYRFLLRALADGGRSDVVYDMNNQSERPGYGYQLKMGATSLTEKWDAGVGNFGSQNHFMSGQINEWFFNDLVGISPDPAGPGFKAFVIKPTILKALNWVKGSYQSLSGEITCEWKRTGSKIMLDIVVPPNTVGTVYLPAGDSKNIEETGGKISDNANIKIIEADKKKMVCRLKSGNYHFICADL
ncbi:family 78 glycoside hydrolase catalytic domain [Mucilaginibacter ginsenosidivorax]|uniref:family 78 glycoside hydrolase catalytic domain n=1 Tax=Mucilaginibacter ginsenosidivorax TaxID=862126 RepID=UPI0013152EF9|nr:family 78 glycoside hydrolase catalytic domain [Mucilaginibacter ginsenosidivorax]